MISDEKANRIWNESFDAISAVKKAYEAGYKDSTLIHNDILNRYDNMIEEFTILQQPVPGTDQRHLRWMLHEMLEGKITGTKAHRWLAFIQGVLIMKGYTTVTAERNFTRPYFTGKP